MSAIAPEGSASSITGNVVAADTSATMAGELASEVISQPAPTSFIQVPMFDTSVASHTARNSRLRSGLQGDDGLKPASLVPHCLPALRAAVMISLATSAGCESIATWLEGTVIVVAFIALANWRSRSGWIM